MKKIAIVFLLFAVVLSCDPQVEEVIQGEDVVLEAGLTDYCCRRLSKITCFSYEIVH